MSKGANRSKSSSLAATDRGLWMPAKRSRKYLGRVGARIILVQGLATGAAGADVAPDVGAALAPTPGGDPGPFKVLLGRVGLVTPLMAHTWRYLHLGEVHAPVWKRRQICLP